MAAPSTAQISSILLAAGAGTRFDPSGFQNKLLQALPNGGTVALHSAHTLLAASGDVIAVVRPGADGLARQLAAAGCEVVACDNAEDGMAASLVCGLRRRLDSAGWLIALADMPYVQASSITVLRRALLGGVQIAVPVYQGRRGHPVGFARRHLPELLALSGDQGARSLLQRYPVTEVVVDDPGIFRDIDQPSDLVQAGPC